MTELATVDQARALTDRIKVAVEGTGLLIQEAYTSRAWSTLGYSSWDDYCTTEFGHLRLQLPKAERLEAVAALRSEGLSTRAIGSALGVHHATVERDLSVGAFAPTAPGRRYNLDEVLAEAGIDPTTLDDEPKETPTVIGTDGKTYKAKSDKARARPRLTSQFTVASADLSRLVARFERLATDDRYRSNRDVIAELCTPEIRRAVQVLDELLRDLAPEENH